MAYVRPTRISAMVKVMHCEALSVSVDGLLFELFQKVDWCMREHTSVRTQSAEKNLDSSTKYKQWFEKIFKSFPVVAHSTYKYTLTPYFPGRQKTRQVLNSSFSFCSSDFTE